MDGLHVVSSATSRRTSTTCHFKPEQHTQSAATTQLDEDADGDGSFELVEDDDPGGQGPRPQLRAMSLCSSADGAMGSSVTSASTRLVADEGEMGLDLMDIPKGLIKKRTKRVKQDRLEDSSWSGKGKGSGFAPVIQKMSPNRKGYPKGSTMSSETQNMSTTTGGTSLGLLLVIWNVLMVNGLQF